MLPLELVHAIIRRVADDRACLKACSLVCRAWLPECRTHLHREVRLESAAQLHRFVQFPDIFGYVLELVIAETRKTDMDSSQELVSKTLETWGTEWLDQPAPGAHEDEDESKNDSRLLVPFESVRRLTLVGTPSVLWHEVWTFVLVAIPNVVDLRFREMREMLLPFSQYEFPDTIAALEVDNIPNHLGAVIGLRLPADSFNFLCYLTLHWLGVYDLPAFGRLMRHTGETLVGLNLLMVMFDEGKSFRLPLLFS